MGIVPPVPSRKSKRASSADLYGQSLSAMLPFSQACIIVSTRVGLNANCGLALATEGRPFEDKI